jgi:iron complex outermembrane receptor protein
MKASYPIQYILPIFLLCIYIRGYAQSTATVSGKVIDEQNQPLIGVVVSVTQQPVHTITDKNGSFSLQLEQGKTYTLQLSYTGYEKQEQQVTISENISLSVKMKPATSQLDQVVVSAGKYNQEIKRVTVSTDIIKPYIIENKAILNMEAVMNQLPGVNVVDGQANIRGGSGWTYGAGSRVLVMLDGLPFITGDANQVQWKFLPTENIEQLEVIKGASSVLYGSSALNGVINVRTAQPTAKPKTSVTLIGGVYNQLKRDSTRWDPGTRYQWGINAYDSRKVNQLDLVMSLNYVKDEGYRMGETDERLRFSVNTNYHSKKYKNWTYGVDESIMFTNAQSFLLWENWSYAYTALDSVTTDSRSTNITINPHTDFYWLGLKHSFRGKILQTTNEINANKPGINQDNSSNMYYGDYQVKKSLFGQLVNLTAGLSASRVKGKAALYSGDHRTGNLAPYLQADLLYKRLSVSAGIRHESFMMDKDHEAKTIGRAGIGFEVTRSTFIRSSFGQGYRFPSIAERYITTSAGAVNVFPNPGLQSETGWNAEFGIRQGFNIKNWKGLADVAYFYTEYQNMVEFNFGQWAPIDFANVLNSFGFKSVNVGNTRISGVDASITGSGKIGLLSVRTLLGYTYTNPVSLTPDKIFATDSGGTSYTYRNTSSDTSSNTLKYRYNHLAKADIEFGYKKVSLGISMRYNSYMQNTDAIFDIIVPGVKQGRAINPNGDYLFDTRISYQATTRFKINFLINNITNHEQMTRPADMRPPRLFLLQLTYVM